ncbi:S-layer homology domain-containing protein [Spirulina major CS-329]|uniref:S-layer homology domain-containing protein n=1 Tax=Spirulina TaxID=1154 RepID=UPI00232A99CA|nr:S-layer homology domain-containing protein [Spirulina major]MDB9496725.1 S-layer homology domain-containing protein [Spirulina subsalsa CS-330]MDB9503200.1 S-layer homology domain-containing protein [Spirulina major CS-329]
MSRWSGWLMLLWVAGCSGDRTAQQWFAPDPQLLDQAEAPAVAPSPAATPTPNPSPTPADSPPPADDIVDDTVKLPQSFPDDVPRYPQAELLTASYRLGVGTGETLWEVAANPAQIARFYRQFLQNKGWTVTEAFQADTAGLTMAQGDTQITLTFPEANRFRLDYRTAAIAPSESPSPPSPEEPVANATLPNFGEDLIQLGAIPTSFQPDATIPRRTFARWLLTTHNRIYRDRPTKQIRPATPSSQPIFADVPTSDPDFAIIQGLAEAGMIPSRLSGSDVTLFQPDAPLSRETLLLWKVPLDQRTTLPTASLQNVQQTWGFQDSDQINPAVFPALLADYDNGDRANLRRAFGYTKLLQPKKTVTQGEAAAALWSFGFQGESITASEAIARPDAATSSTSPPP